MSDSPIEFDCIDCGRHVIAFGYNAQFERCNSCFWITQNIAPADQPAARERLGVPLAASLANEEVRLRPSIFETCSKLRSSG
jgi:hypothetical protein